MNLRHKLQSKTTIAALFDKHFENQQYVSEDNLHFLVDLVHLFRPKKPQKQAVVSIAKLIRFLEENPDKRALIIDYLTQIFSERKFSRMLSDAAILQDTDFIFEVKKRLLAKVLPYQPQKDTLQYVLNQVFYLNSDAVWIDCVPLEELLQLYDLLSFKDIYVSVKEKSPLSELLNVMNLIPQRMSGRAMENDVIKMVPEYSQFESPFTAFEKELQEIIDKVRGGSPHYIAADDLLYKQLLILHKQCEEYVDRAFANSSKYGISIKVNQSLLRIRQQLHRMKILIPLLVVTKKEDKKYNTIQLALLLIKFNCYKNNVGQLINESTQLLSYEITQHTAKTGEHYITESVKEYFGMLKASLGGGFIVGILCIIKLLFSKIETSAFGHAFLYSLNYSLGFIAIYLCGFTLATKQPAMTAATVIQALEKGMKKKGKTENKHSSFAKLFARLFRSQFIAFVGNVVMAFPVSLLGIWLIDQAFGYNIATSKWPKLLGDLNPMYSPAILHASIAGVFLFLSGIISGSVSNRNKHNQVYYRIQEHPFLKMSLGAEKTRKIARWFENNWAGVVSNGWFGVFLGSTASIGIFLGLNLDIRHITFASGNFALGLYGMDFKVDLWMIAWSILGIGLIGFMNFIVSFGLSIGLAFRSRNIPVSEFRLLNKAIWNQFKKRPLSFFLPVKDKHEEETATA